ncbi:MAG: hypothetical protein HUJ68_09720 [Clostridia bacterium]|nr:hypothetical protein [Clostridia bacterium]
MTILQYIDKLEQAYIAKGYSKQEVNALIIGFKLGCEFAGSIASGTIADLLVKPFKDDDNVLKPLEKKEQSI